MSYPQTPGYSVPGPSKEAAKLVRHRALSRRKRILLLLESIHPQGLTANEIASRLDYPIYKIWPRLAEMHTGGKIEQTGEKRMGECGVLVNCWRAVLEYTDEANHG